MARETHKTITIASADDLLYLLSRVNKGPVFAEKFQFEDDSLFERFLSEIGISIEEFNTKFYYFDSTRDLHISESTDGFVWISTMGLVASKEHNNSYFDACTYQFHTIMLLLEKAISICDEESVYDINSNLYSDLNELTPTIFHNILFYFEVFGKAYLALSNVKPVKTHCLAEIYKVVNKTMYQLKHNNTLFHAQIIKDFERLANYISSLPGNFKEHFVKYDENPEDNTVIKFDRSALENVKATIEMSYDFINSYRYSKENALYLIPGLYEKFVERAASDEEKDAVREKFSYLISS